MIQTADGAFWVLRDDDNRNAGGPRYRSIERKERLEVPGIAYADLVDPIAVEVTREEAEATVTRYWDPDDAEVCSLCPICAARPSAARPGTVQCTRSAPPDISQEDAAHHQSEWKDVLP